MSDHARYKLQLEALMKVRDGLRLAADSLNEYIETYQPTEAPKKSLPDLNVISWKNAQGPHGPFQVADLENNKGNQPFLELLEILKVHEGKMRISTDFLWLFETGQAIIGRKKVEP